MTDTRPVEPADAATVILVREGSIQGSSWQCFMVRRHVQSDFAADVYVFPGGKVDAADHLSSAHGFIQDVRADARNRHEDPNVLRTLKLAAIRELFEEAGILLAYRQSGQLLRLEGEEAAQFVGYRRRLQTYDVTMSEMAMEARLRYAADRLHPFSRWITPETLPRRFDTRFFVAELPAGQRPLHDALETTHGAWISPASALILYREGNFPLVFATEKHLERLACYPSVEALLTGTASADLAPIMPRIVHQDGEDAFLLPGDPDY